MTARILSALLALALLLAGWQWRKAVSIEAEYARYRADISGQISLAEATARAEEQRRTIRAQEAQDAAYKARLAAESDARAARASADRLRQRAAELAASCSARDPAPASPGQAASAPGDLLADMLFRLDEAAGELARHADESRIAGQLCQRSYEALSPP